MEDCLLEDLDGACRLFENPLRSAVAGLAAGFADSLWVIPAAAAFDSVAAANRSLAVQKGFGYLSAR